VTLVLARVGNHLSGLLAYTEVLHNGFNMCTCGLPEMSTCCQKATSPIMIIAHFKITI